MFKFVSILVILLSAASFVPHGILASSECDYASAVKSGLDLDIGFITRCNRVLVSTSPITDENSVPFLSMETHILITGIEITTGIFNEGENARLDISLYCDQVTCTLPENYVENRLLYDVVYDRTLYNSTRFELSSENFRSTETITLSYFYDIPNISTQSLAIAVQTWVYRFYLVGYSAPVKEGKLDNKDPF